MPDGSGPGRKAQVSDKEILEALNSGMARAGAPALSTSDVADFLPISRQAVKRRLEKLSEKGEVGVHKAGRNRFWWVPDEKYTGGQLDSDGQFDLNEIVEEGDLSDERLIELFQEQIDPEDLPDSFVEQILQKNLSPNDIQDEIVFEKLRNDIDYSEFPKEVASDIAQEVFDYDSSYWARWIRGGVYSLAFAMLVLMFVFIFSNIGSNPPELLSTLFGAQLITAVFEALTMIAALAWVILCGAGVALILIGFLSRKLKKGDEPPLDGYLPMFKQKYL